jgi:hypothetical protein
LTHSRLAARLRVGVNVGAGLRVEVVGQGFPADAEGVQENVECGVHVGVAPIHPDLGVRPGMAVVVAESEMGFPDAEYRGIDLAQRILPAPLKVQSQPRSQPPAKD